MQVVTPFRATLNNAPQLLHQLFARTAVGEVIAWPGYIVLPEVRVAERISYELIE